MNRRICAICKEDLPITEFGLCSMRLDKISIYCKECSRQKTKRRYWNNRDYVLELMKKSYQKNRANIRKYQSKRSKLGWKNYYEKNKEKHKAREKLRYMVRVGKIIKPKKCERCKEENPLQGHHHDYTKPLDVKWLCKKCHYFIHRSLIITDLEKEI